MIIHTTRSVGPSTERPVRGPISSHGGSRGPGSVLASSDQKEVPREGGVNLLLDNLMSERLLRKKEKLKRKNAAKARGKKRKEITRKRR